MKLIWIPGSKEITLFPDLGKLYKGCYPTGKEACLWHFPALCPLFISSAGHTEHFQDAFDRQSLVLDKLPLAFYAGMFAYSGW